MAPRQSSQNHGKTDETDGTERTDRTQKSAKKARLETARQRVAEQRAREAKAARRRSVTLGAVAAVVAAGVIAGLVAVVTTDSDDDKAGPSGGKNGAITANVVVAPNVTSPIPGVVAYTAARDHVAGEVVYPQVPPVGGEHDERWLTCTAYDQPVANRNAVHSLEHGAVWLTYDPGLPADQVEKLKARATKPYTLLSPYPGMSTPIAVIAWGMQLKVDSADDPRIDEFINLYRNNRQTTPEYGAPCDGGVMP